ncbi:MAG: FAD-dependent oxidoreductase [Candidatus Acidiferrales bacterium]
MIKDFSKFDDGATVTADVCIVGAGAAGIAIAREFVSTHHTVVVLESGGLDTEPETHKLYESEVVGLPHTGIHAGRARVFGGTTTLWGGQALRFSSFDLQKRYWVPFSGWPFSSQELDPYYERAARVLHLGPRIPYNDLCASFGIEPPTFDPSKLYMQCSQWSPRPNFGTAYRRELNDSHNVSVLLHANVTGIITNEAATTVENIEFRTLSGKKGIAKTRFYIICCGGIETARLLLASNRIERDGVGNRTDLVGRYFQEHIHIRCGNLLATNRQQLQSLFESFFIRRLKYAPLITLSERVQTKRHLVSILGTVGFEPTPDSCISATKILFRAAIGKSYPKIAELKRLLANVLADPGELIALAYRLYIQKRAGTPKRGPIYIGAQCEMAPNPESRVLLSDSRDCLGMHRVKLDWRLGEMERRTISEFIITVASEFERLGLVTFDSAQIAALDDPTAWLAMAHDSAHHMGTVRMHETPQLGVVDPNCRVYGIANLYIGSSAVFPTGACSNPTLTILALCLRIADRLKKLL